MHQIVQAFPDPEALIALEPEELGSRLLFLLRRHGERIFTVSSLLHGPHDGNLSMAMGQQPYAMSYRDRVQEAILEAWAWLEVQGLIVWPDPTNGRNGFRMLSRRARRFPDEAALKDFAAATALPKSMLHPRIAEKVWLSFVRNDFDTAVFQAMREVEIAVRETGDYQADSGVPLMFEAFGPKGPLLDPSMEKGEAKAIANLFAGAIGVFKNAQSHRNVSLSHPIEAAEIVMFTSHLLRLSEARGARPDHN